jgi:hypothetical protein
VVALHPWQKLLAEQTRQLGSAGQEAQKLGLEQELHKLLVVVQFRTQVALVKTYPVAQTAHWFGPLQEVQLDNVHKKH